MGAACDWDCTGPGLVLPVLGSFDLNLTADCTVEVRAWGGGGGGGGGGVGGRTAGGGGGGGSTAVLDGTGTVWIAAAGGGGGGGGTDGRRGGGGGGGGYGSGVFAFPAGTALALRVGGGGQAGCAITPGDGGGPDGGVADCGLGAAELGGAAGRNDCWGSGNTSTYGGGGGGNGNSAWGGAGGSDTANTMPRGCFGRSQFGEDGGCGNDDDGGGGGGGSAFADVVQLGTTGANGASAGAGGAGATGAAGGIDGAPAGAVPGGGGAGSEGCLGGAGGTGWMEIVPVAGPGAACPSGEILDCGGACVRASWLGDGVCDAAFDCAAHGSDNGDCPATGGVEIPGFMRTACPTVTAESAFCVTATEGGEFALLGADTGTVCPIAPMRSTWSSYGDMALPPPYRELVVCEWVPKVYDLEYGTVTELPGVCEGAVADGAGVMLQDYYVTSVFQHFPSLADLYAGNGTQIGPLELWAVFYDTDGTRVYGTWFVTHHVQQVDRITGARGPNILLQGFDETDTVWGLDVGGGAIRIVDGATLHTFDVATGQRLSTVPAPVIGLACVTP